MTAALAERSLGTSAHVRAVLQVAINNYCDFQDVRVQDGIVDIGGPRDAWHGAKEAAIAVLRTDTGCGREDAYFAVLGFVQSLCGPALWGPDVADPAALLKRPGGARPVVTRPGDPTHQGGDDSPDQGRVEAGQQGQAEPAGAEEAGPEHAPDCVDQDRCDCFSWCVLCDTWHGKGHEHDWDGPRGT